MTANGLPCLDMLEAIPEILRGLMCELSEDDANWKPAADRFSVAEVLAHLSHTEGHCNRLRVDRIMSEERPAFEGFDAKDYLDKYRGANAEDAFDHFEEQREINVEYLRGLPPGSGDRIGLHRIAGELTLAQLLNSWAMHDLGHIRQVAELVAARKYLAGAGPMARYHHLKP
jgi:hypothetical protein